MSIGARKIGCVEEWMSEYQLSLQNKINGGEKLVLNFKDKDKHVLYYRNLQLYLYLGMKLKKYIEYLNSSRKHEWNRIFVSMQIHVHLLQMALQRFQINLE